MPYGRVKRWVAVKCVTLQHGCPHSPGPCGAYSSDRELFPVTERKSYEDISKNLGRGDGHSSDDRGDYVDDSGNSGSGDDSLDNSTDTDDSGDGEIVWDDNGDWSEE